MDKMPSDMNGRIELCLFHTFHEQENEIDEKNVNNFN